MLRLNLLKSSLHVCSPGPTSPIDWVESCVLTLAPEPSVFREKILMGLNFYGYDFTTSGMDGELVRLYYGQYIHSFLFIYSFSNCWTEVKHSTYESSSYSICLYIHIYGWQRSPQYRTCVIINWVAWPVLRIKMTVCTCS